jgi:peptidoglycan/xylan/chitin deacetylase (PgdA/CDA1 family)
VICRRTLLKAGIASLISAARPVPIARGQQRWIAVPPSVMLHARQDHLDNLSVFADWLFDNGFTPITYQTLWAALTAGDPLPASPIIVSIDDLILVRGSNNFYFIEKMVNILIEKGVPAVLGINTEPLVVADNGQIAQLHDQDETLWETATGWSKHGIELATHTQTHQNLTDATLTPDDYQREIGGSAQMIVDRAGQTVTTLVLPYGNGWQDGAVIPPIVAACHAAGIGMVVGVADGRMPLIAAPADTQPIYFVGRVGPLRDSFGSIYRDVEHWRAQNDQRVGSDTLP